VRIAITPLLLAACHAANDAAIDSPADTSADSIVAPSCASGAFCDGLTGLCAEEPVCSPASPCATATVNGNKVTNETSAFSPPTCNRNGFNDAPARTWTDAVNGQSRAACVFVPSATLPLPLVLFLHGSGTSGDQVYTTTLLRAKAATFDLTGDPARPGFVLASDTARIVQSTLPGGNGAQVHEVYFRDFRSPSSSSDFRNFDRLIDELVATGKIDPKRIYIVGYSNGGFAGQLYGLARYATPTPGGNYVAAVAVYGAASPLYEPMAGLDGCRFQPFPHVALPIMIVHRACDWEPCDATQLVTMGRPPGYSIGDWLTTLTTQIGSVDSTGVTLDDTGHIVTACDNGPTCTISRGLTNHGHWPDGQHDGGGIDHEPEMLAFLRAHPHP
jgi:pimeloyl-ACP methyl ester carboxylesterase